MDERRARVKKRIEAKKYFLSLKAKEKLTVISRRKK